MRLFIEIIGSIILVYYISSYYNIKAFAVNLLDDYHKLSDRMTKIDPKHTPKH